MADSDTKKVARFKLKLDREEKHGSVMGPIPRATSFDKPIAIQTKGRKTRERPFPYVDLDDTIKFKSAEEFAMNPDASTRASLLSEKYGVEVEVVETDKDFYSDAFIKESIENKKYYVSEESPKSTAQATDWLIRYQAEKDRYVAQEAQERKLVLLNIANEKRSEKSVQTAQDLAPKIAEITQQYSDTHGGKEPSLHKLADLLNDAKVPAPGGSQSKWYAQTVKRIINAEKPVHQK